jgi:hypothetical protein
MENMARAWTHENNKCGTHVMMVLEENDPLHPIKNGSCPVTSQLRLFWHVQEEASFQNHSHSHSWSLQRLDARGHNKMVGGEEYCIFLFSSIR